MDTKEIIESYVDDVALLLPRKQRNDIGLELRSLLADQLQAAAAAAGREPDRELALDVLRQFGRPEDVADRYRTRGFEIIEPAHAPLFVKLSAICVALQWAITMPAVYQSRTTLSEWWLGWGFGALAWVGLLVIWFGMNAWTRRRWPADANGAPRSWTHWLFWLPSQDDWRPADRELLGGHAAMKAAPLGALLATVLVAPAWFADLLSPAGTDTSWALYDEQFRRWLLPPLLALMFARLLLLAVVAANGRLRARTESLRFALWALFVALLCWALVGWTIFANLAVNSLFKAWLLVFLLVNTIQLVLWIRRALHRVRPPPALLDRGSRA